MVLTVGMYKKLCDLSICKAFVEGMYVHPNRMVGIQNKRKRLFLIFEQQIIHREIIMSIFSQ